MIKLEDLLNENKKPGLWANIRAKRARGEKPSHGNSNAHKDAVKAGKKIKEDSTSNDADNFVAFLKSKLDLDNLKEEYKSKVGDLVRSEEDYAIDYYNVIDDLANEDIE